MSGSLTAAVGAVTVAGGNLTLVAIVALIAIAALGVAWVLAREVLAASQGTEKMQEIAGGGPGGRRGVPRPASSGRSSSSRSLVVLPAVPPAGRHHRRSKIGRSIFFLVGAVFSAITGYTGMWLAVRGNVRVAAAANEATASRRR